MCAITTTAIRVPAAGFDKSN